MFFYLFTIRQSSSVWALLISLNSKEYILTVVLKVWHLDQQQEHYLETCQKLWRWAKNL